MNIQSRLADPKVKYSLGSYNKVKGDTQTIRVTEGCPHNCDWCYEPTVFKIFDIPEIKRNKVLIIDMNILAKEESYGIIASLPKELNGKSVYYEFRCGLDFRFMTKEIADLIYERNFGRFRYDKHGNPKNWKKGIRIAWDRGMEFQYQIKDCINMLENAGFKRNQISVFMIYNHSVTTFYENMRKLDLCKIWNVQVDDCRFDNQVKTFIPIAWSVKDMKDFRRKVRKHNQLVNFKIDPELKSLKNQEAKR